MDWTVVLRCLRVRRALPRPGRWPSGRAAPALLAVLLPLFGPARTATAAAAGENIRAIFSYNDSTDRWGVSGTMGIQGGRANSPSLFYVIDHKGAAADSQQLGLTQMWLSPSFTSSTVSFASENDVQIVADGAQEVRVQKAVSPASTRLEVHRIAGKVTLRLRDNGPSGDQLDLSFAPKPGPTAGEAIGQLSVTLAGSDLELVSLVTVRIATAAMVGPGVLEVHLQPSGYTRPRAGWLDIRIVGPPHGHAAGPAFPCDPAKRHIVTARQDLLPSREAVFRVDLAAERICRFTGNTSLGIAVGLQHLREQASSLDTRQLVVLQPIVLVPGIAPLAAYRWLPENGGNGTFPDLEGWLRETSDDFLVRKGWLGEGYRLGLADASLYPTLYTLKYDRNRASFEEGARALDKQIQEVRDRTYADQVTLVTHSKGGLVARAYLQKAPGADKPLAFDPQFRIYRVREFIAMVPPNLGSVDAWDWPTALPGDYSNLYPLWPWNWGQGGRYQTSYATGDPDCARANFGLGALNGLLDGRNTSSNYQPFPREVPFTIVWSGDTLEDLRTTYARNRGDLTCAGDGIVPAFSQLGLMRNPNSRDRRIQDPNDWSGTRVPALAGRIELVRIDGFHSGPNKVPIVSGLFPKVRQGPFYPELEAQRQLILDHALPGWRP